MNLALVAAALVTNLAVADAPQTPTAAPRPVVQSEKDARTPAQQKINSQLLYEIYRRRGEAARKQVPPDPTNVRLDRSGRALVDIRAEITPAFEKKVRAVGSTIVSTSREYRSIVAWVPVLKLERLAADIRVHAIQPAPESTVSK